MIQRTLHAQLASAQHVRVDHRGSQIVVTEKRQRSGVGRALLRHVTERLRGEGTGKVYLITGPDSGAAAFYSAHGFHVSRGRIVMASSITSS